MWTDRKPRADGFYYFNRIEWEEVTIVYYHADRNSIVLPGDEVVRTFTPNHKSIPYETIRGQFFAKSGSNKPIKIHLPK